MKKAECLAGGRPLQVLWNLTLVGIEYDHNLGKFGIQINKAADPGMDKGCNSPTGLPKVT